MKEDPSARLVEEVSKPRLLFGKRGILVWRGFNEFDQPYLLRITGQYPSSLDPLVFVRIRGNWEVF
jgi:hypothetical protein